MFFNNTGAPGSFAAPVTLMSPGASQVAIGDMNGDGLPDLVSADFNVSLFLQTSPGTFASLSACIPAARIGWRSAISMAMASPTSH